MHTRTVVVGAAVGLHVRPAQVIAEAVEASGAEVRIARPGEEPVDAGSALLIMTLGAGPGDRVEISSEVAGALDAIAALVERDLDA